MAKSDADTDMHKIHVQYITCTNITQTQLICYLYTYIRLMHYPPVSLFFFFLKIKLIKTEFLISCLRLALDKTALLFLINNTSIPNEVEHKWH